jgi:hypothetical protein
MPKVAKKKVAPPKKSTAKKTAAAKKSPASRGRATSTSNKSSASSKKGTTKKAASSKKTASKRTPPVREINKDTGFVVGSDQDVIAQAFLKGAETRQDIIDACRKKLDSETRNGTEKPVSNIVSSVFNKMLREGFRLESTYRLLPPTPASKRKAAAKK